MISRKPLKRILQWTQRLLVAAGVSMLGYVGFAVADAWIFQRRAAHELERLTHQARQAQALASSTGPPASPEPPAIGPDGLIGRIEIPRLGVSTIVVEGTDRKTLRRAVGHISTTALPGKPGNVGLAGHRDTFFRPLKDIRQNDVITLTTLRGDYRYRVVSTRVVSPTEISVLAPSGGEILTLVTCYPFYFVGSAPDRFIVRAERAP